MWWGLKVDGEIVAVQYSLNYQPKLVDFRYAMCGWEEWQIVKVDIYEN